MFYGDFEQDELLFFSVALHLVARRLLVDGTGSLIRALIGSNRLWLRLFPFTALLGERLAALRAVFLIWIYFWTRNRLSLILVTSCSAKCL